jgi:hypothetical protein
MTDLLAAARDYLERGWAPIPVPLCTKGPLPEVSPTFRISAESAPNFFNRGAQNIGIALGARSGGLCDIDLDCSEAIAAAPYILPRTAVFGHASKRGSHWIYRTNLCETQDRAALKFVGSDKLGLLEVRMAALRPRRRSRSTIRKSAAATTQLSYSAASLSPNSETVRPAASSPSNCAGRKPSSASPASSNGG